MLGGLGETLLLLLIVVLLELCCELLSMFKVSLLLKMLKEQLLVLWGRGRRWRWRWGWRRGRRRAGCKARMVVRRKGGRGGWRGGRVGDFEDDFEQFLLMLFGDITGARARGGARSSSCSVGKGVWDFAFVGRGWCRGWG